MEQWKPQSHLVYSSWIDKILTDSQSDLKELTDWEQKFIDSMYLRLRMKQPISQLQAEKLEQIYVKYTH